MNANDDDANEAQTGMFMRTLQRVVAIEVRVALIAEARELGVDLGQLTGTGFKARITHEDIKAYVKKALSGGAAGAGGAPAGARSGSGLPALPVVDFAKFGPIETKPLSRIQKISGPRLQASWVNIPHVTQFDEADITDLEDVRVKKDAIPCRRLGLMSREILLKRLTRFHLYV